MSIENEKPVPRSLKTPGRDDLSPWPPIGQMKFEQIVQMKDAQLDRAILERHGLSKIFKSDTSNSIRTESRRVQIKRVVLARLEGYPTGQESELEKWYDPPNEETLSPLASLSVLFSRELTSECKKRIVDVTRKVAREAQIAQAPIKIRKIHREISNVLSRAGLTPLSVEEIFSTTKIPPHAANSASNKYDVEFWLKYFLLRIQGNQLRDTAEKLHVDEQVLHILPSRHLSKTARDTIRLANKWNILLDKN